MIFLSKSGKICDIFHFTTFLSYQIHFFYFFFHFLFQRPPVEGKALTGDYSFSQPFSLPSVSYSDSSLSRSLSLSRTLSASHHSLALCFPSLGHLQCAHPSLSVCIQPHTIALSSLAPTGDGQPTLATVFSLVVSLVFHSHRSCSR